MTWMTPAKEVAPYITGAAPSWTSMRSTPLRLKVESAGLKAPPQGTPSTTSRKASNSFRPQNSGTAPAGPPSPPGASVTPASSPRAPRKSRAPRSARSLAVRTVMEAGTLAGSSGKRVAVTSTAAAGGTGGRECHIRVPCAREPGNRPGTSGSRGIRPGPRWSGSDDRPCHAARAQPGCAAHPETPRPPGTAGGGSP